MYVEPRERYFLLQGLIYSWFHKKVLGVYTYSMETIYLSLRAQVAVGTFFMKSPVLDLL